MKLLKKPKDSMIFFKNFLREKPIIHGILEKKDGPIDYSNIENTIKILLNSLEKIGFKNFKKENLVFAEQVHGNEVFICPKNLGGLIKLGVDALISRNKNQILVIKTADCLPILIYDRKKKQVAGVHAGREGLIKGVLPKVIKILNTDNRNLLVGIGPHIRKCCYFLRKKAKDVLNKKEILSFIEKRKEKYYLSLTDIAISQLVKCGVKKENIEDLGICTFCNNKNFYSFRYQEKKKKFFCFGSFIGLI